MTDQSRWLLFKVFIALSSISIVTIWAFGATLEGDFLFWDTKKYVVDNPHIKAFTWTNLVWMLTDIHLSYPHPLTWFSHALDYALFGLSPWGHHLTNLIIHCLNAVLVFGLTLILLILDKSVKPAYLLVHLDDKTLFAAAIAALFFSIHPQRVETVAWIAERKAVLCMLFSLLTLITYLLYANSNSHKARRAWYLTAIVCFIAALLSKPMAVTIPLILLCFDIYPLHRTSLTGISTASTYISYKTLFLEKIPFFLGSSILALGTTLAVHNVETVSSMTEVNIQIRLLNAFNSILVYISKLLFPINLSPFYPFPSIRSFDEHYLSLIPMLVFIVITFVLGYLWRKKHYYWLIGWLFYLISLLPVIGIVQVGGQGSADRYTYFTMLPFYILIGVGIVHFYSIPRANFNKAWKISIFSICLATIFTLVHLTQQQVLIWKNDVIFWEYIALQEPHHPIVRSNLATAHFLAGNYTQAIENYEVAQTIDPTLINSGKILAYLRLNAVEKALFAYEQILPNLSSEESHVPSLVHLAVSEAYLKQKRFPEAQQAVKRVLIIHPDSKLAQNLLKQITEQMQLPPATPNTP